MLYGCHGTIGVYHSKNNVLIFYTEVQLLCPTELWLLRLNPFHLLNLGVPAQGIELIHNVLGGRGRLVPHVAELLLEAYRQKQRNKTEGLPVA